MTRVDGRRRVRLENGTELFGEQVLVAIGRAPRVSELALETVGIEPSERGIEVDERCRAAEGVWAVGDVTGVMPFTHVGKYQGRVAVADIAGRPAQADYRSIPRVVFCEPEVAACVLSATTLRDD